MVAITSDPSSHGAKKNTQFMSGVTLCKNMIGCGIFSLPLGLKCASIWPGLIVCILVGLVSAVAFFMLGFCCHTWKIGTYRGAWLKAISPQSHGLPSLSCLGGAVDWTLFVNGTLTLVTYTILMADFFSGASKGLFGEDSPLALSRMSAIMTLAFVVLIPVCLKPNLSGLGFTSALGLVAMGYAVSLIYFDAFTSPSLNVGETAVPYLEAKWGAFQTIALFSHSFVAHYNAPGLYHEMENNTLGRWATLVGVSYLFATFVYASFAYAGVARFGMTTEGNLLRMFEPTTPVLCAWVAIGISTSMTYPLVFAGFRDSAIGLLCSMRGLTAEKLSPERHETLRRVLTVFFVTGSAVAGGVCDDLGVANALAGAVTGSLITFIFPGLMFYSAMKDLAYQASHPGLMNRFRNRPHEFALMTATAIAVTAAGFIFMVVGTAVVIYDSFQ